MQQQEPDRSRWGSSLLLIPAAGLIFFGAFGIAAIFDLCSGSAPCKVIMGIGLGSAIALLVGFALIRVAIILAAIFGAAASLASHVRRPT